MKHKYNVQGFYPGSEGGYFFSRFTHSSFSGGFFCRFYPAGFVVISFLGFFSAENEVIFFQVHVFDIACGSTDGQCNNSVKTIRNRYIAQRTWRTYKRNCIDLFQPLTICVSHFSYNIPSVAYISRDCTSIPLFSFLQPVSSTDLKYLNFDERRKNKETRIQKIMEETNTEKIQCLSTCFYLKRFHKYF